MTLGFYDDIFVHAFQLTNSDHTKTVISNILLKFNFDQAPSDFVIAQLLPGSKGTSQSIVQVNQTKCPKSPHLPDNVNNSAGNANLRIPAAKCLNFLFQILI